MFWAVFSGGEKGRGGGLLVSTAGMNKSLVLSQWIQSRIRKTHAMEETPATGLI